MAHQRPSAVVSASLAFILLLACSSFTTMPVSAQVSARPGPARIVPDVLRTRAEQSGRVRVIVELKLPGRGHIAEGQLRSLAEVTAQRRELQSATGRVLARL